MFRRGALVSRGAVGLPSAFYNRAMRAAPYAVCARSVCTPTAPLLQKRKFTMSKRRRMMQQKHYALPGPSIPIGILIMLFATFNIFVTMAGKYDDNVYG